MEKIPKKQHPVSIRKAIALVCEQTQMHKYYLVYWPEEESVTAVSAEAISCPPPHQLEVGVDCEVTIRRQTHRGKIAAKGSKSEMESCERRFVSGEWTPSIVNGGTGLSSHNTTAEQPPAKKPKHVEGAQGKENRKDTGATKGKKKPPGKQVRSQSKKGKEKENEQGAEKTSKGKKNTKGAILCVTQCGATSGTSTSAGVSCAVRKDTKSRGSGDEPISNSTSEVVPVSVPSGSSIGPTTDSPQPGVEPISASSEGAMDSEDHASALDLSESDPLHLEMTIQCLQDTVEKLQSNQDSILLRLQAVETLMREQNLAHKNREPTVQPVSPPRSSPERSPAPAPAQPLPWDQQYSPSPTPSPLPPPLPPLPNPFTPGRNCHNISSRDSLQYSPQLWYNHLSSAFPGCSPAQCPQSMSSSSESYRSLLTQQNYPANQSYPTSYPTNQSYPTSYPTNQSYPATVPCYQQPSAVTSPQSSSTCGQPPRCLPVKTRKKSRTLSSSAIAFNKLSDPDEVIKKYKNYRTISKAPTLTTKLAIAAYFGERVLKQCTVFGCREQPALPIKELNDLKQKVFSLFPQFWVNPLDFEATWGLCAEAVGQACKRLRNQ